MRSSAIGFSEQCAISAYIWRWWAKIKQHSVSVRTFRVKSRTREFPRTKCQCDLFHDECGFSVCFLCRSQRPRGLKREIEAVHLLESPTGCMDVCRVSVVSSGRGLCDVLITRPQDTYRLSCVTVCVLKTSRFRRPWPALGCGAIDIRLTAEVSDWQHKDVWATPVTVLFQIIAAFTHIIKMRFALWLLDSFLCSFIAIILDV
jgi:hypothetical protein